METEMKKFFGMAMGALLGMALIGTSAFAQARQKSSTERLTMPADMAVIALNTKTGYAQMRELKLPSTTAAGNSCKIKAGASITLVGPSATTPGTFEFVNNTAGSSGYCPRGTKFNLVGEVVDKLRTAANAGPTLRRTPEAIPPAERK